MIQVIEKGDQISRLPSVTYLGLFFGAYVSLASARELFQSPKSSQVSKVRIGPIARLTFGVALFGLNAHQIYKVWFRPRPNSNFNQRNNQGSYAKRQ